MAKKLLIIGAGSVGKFIAYNITHFTQSFEIIGFLDDDVSKHSTVVAGFPVLGSLAELASFSGKNIAIVWGIAFPTIKNELFEHYQNLDFEFPSFISKDSWLSNEVSVGKGCIIYPGVSINYETTIGDFVVINMNCAIGHNCSIGNFSSLSPGVNIGGNSSIGERVAMGIGAATLQSIIITNDCNIGGQSMVTKNILTPTTVIGIPAKPFE